MISRHDSCLNGSILDTQWRDQHRRQTSTCFLCIVCVCKVEISKAAPTGSGRCLPPVHALPSAVVRVEPLPAAFPSRPSFSLGRGLVSAARRILAAVGKPKILGQLRRNLLQLRGRRRSLWRQTPARTCQAVISSSSAPAFPFIFLLFFYLSTPSSFYVLFEFQLDFSLVILRASQ